MIALPRYIIIPEEIPRRDTTMAKFHDVHPIAFQMGPTDRAHRKSGNATSLYERSYGTYFKTKQKKSCKSRISIGIVLLECFFHTCTSRNTAAAARSERFFWGERPPHHDPCLTHVPSHSFDHPCLEQEIKSSLKIPRSDRQCESPFSG